MNTHTHAHIQYLKRDSRELQTGFLCTVRAANNTMRRKQKWKRRGGAGREEEEEEEDEEEDEGGGRGRGGGGGVSESQGECSYSQYQENTIAHAGGGMKI